MPTNENTKDTHNTNNGRTLSIMRNTKEDEKANRQYGNKNHIVPFQLVYQPVTLDIIRSNDPGYVSGPIKIAPRGINNNKEIQ